MIRPHFTDTAGKAINAHGGMILEWENHYYWYGEYKIGKTVCIPQRAQDGTVHDMQRLDFVGISCYRSEDLQAWEFCGLCLEACPQPDSDLYPGGVVERPRVIYHAASNRFIMYLHVDSPDYSKASLGVAVADRPEGPFRYLHSFRPCGMDSRDFTLWQDTDTDEAYVLFSSDGNSTMRIAPLTEDYLHCVGSFTDSFPGRFREAPVVFRDNGRMYSITSGCSGWAPNAAAWASAPHPEGPWELFDNPCRGDGAEITYGGQATCTVTHCGHRYVLADIWNPADLESSTYFWMACDMQTGKPILTKLEED